MTDRYYIGLATTFHDPALAIVAPDGSVVFAEAAERFLQYKRAPNCEPDPAPRMGALIARHVPAGAEIVVATSWSRRKRTDAWTARRRPVVRNVMSLR